jgi:hypothetical protein
MIQSMVSKHILYHNVKYCSRPFLSTQHLKVVTVLELVSQAALELQGSEKACLLAATVVPLPNANNVLTAYNSNLCSSAGNGPASRDVQFIRNMEHQVSPWMLHAPAYKILALNLVLHIVRKQQQQWSL